MWAKWPAGVKAKEPKVSTQPSGENYYPEWEIVLWMFCNNPASMWPGSFWPAQLFRNHELCSRYSMRSRYSGCVVTICLPLQRASRWDSNINEGTTINMQWFIFIGICRVELSRLGQCSHGIIGLRFQKIKKQNKEKPLRLLKINQYFPFGSCEIAEELCNETEHSYVSLCDQPPSPCFLTWPIMPTLWISSPCEVFVPYKKSEPFSGLLFVSFAQMHNILIQE